MPRKKKCNDRSGNTTYEILVEGQLSDEWSPWFENLSISLDTDPKNGVPITTISGRITDQAALHGILEKIRDLNLKLLSVRSAGFQSDHQDDQLI